MDFCSYWPWLSACDGIGDLHKHYAPTCNVQKENIHSIEMQRDLCILHVSGLVKQHGSGNPPQKTKHG